MLRHGDVSLELRGKKKPHKIHKSVGKKGKTQRVGLVPQKGSKKDGKSSPFCLYPFSEEKRLFALRKNGVCAQWGKAATQRSNGKNCSANHF